MVDLKMNDLDLMDENGISGLGYKVLIKTLTETIVNVAKSTDQINDGTMIGDAIKLLQTSLIDTDLKKPSYSKRRKLKSR